MSTGKNRWSFLLLLILSNKIRDKGRIVSAGYRGGKGERDGAEWVVREGEGEGGRNDLNIVCIYE
jgi:hypothetical protein